MGMPELQELFLHHDRVSLAVHQQMHSLRSRYEWRTHGLTTDGIRRIASSSLDAVASAFAFMLVENLPESS
jgi:hypothetical protein